MTRRALFLMLALAACGSDSKKNPDAAVQKDAPAATVQAVTCPATPAATITTTDAEFKYTPNAATITVGQVVKFVMSSTHNVVPDPGNDPGLLADFNKTTCLMFTAAGTFKFHCAPHSFAGTVTVQ